MTAGAGGHYPSGVKYAIVIADGAADLPLPQLGGKTPLQAARTPNIDAVARSGRLGTARTTPEGFAAGSDVCTMSLLGYDPRRYHTGRAPLEAAAMGVPMGERDTIFRLNLVTVGEEGTPDAGLMLDHSAGSISDGEAKRLVGDLLAWWREQAPELAAGFSLTHGVSYRSILVDRTGREYGELQTTPPHEIPRQAWAPNVPRAGGAWRAGAEALVRLMDLAAEFLPDHPVNVERRAAGKRPANMAWIWGQGSRPMLPAFSERFGLKGAMITAVDLLAGIAALMGWERLNVPGITSYHDTDYAAQGRAACEALDRFDIVCCHVESPDEAAHQADWQTKVAAIEEIDAKVVGPMVEKLKGFGDAERDAKAEGWRLLIMPDHYTLVSTRKHDATPAPFAMAGNWIRAHRTGTFDEVNCNEADLHIAHGHELMEFFLFGGRPKVGKTLSRG